MKLINLYLKYILDYCLVIILLPFLFVPIVLISILILFIDGHPIFFIQKRTGKNRKLINIIKFRTLTQYKNKKIASRLGKFLRLTRLDELPQIFNMLRGNLSFVGPRPLYTKYTKLYNQRQLKRLKVKPGITGWAQVNGDNNISWKKKFDLDIWYVNNFNIILDLKIIYLTMIFFVNALIHYKKNKRSKVIIDKEFNGKN